MTFSKTNSNPKIVSRAQWHGESRMVGQELGGEIHLVHEREHLMISEPARRLERCRKTIRHCMRESVWQPCRIS